MKRPVPLFICLAVPLIVFLIGASLASVYGFREIPKLLDESARGLVPEGFEASLDRPGKYTVWLQVRGAIGNHFHRGPEKLPPGARIYLYEAESGREIEVIKWLQATKNIGHEHAIALGTFRVGREGQRVEVRGSGLSRPVLISISPENTGRVIQVILSLLGIFALTLSVALGCLFLLLHRRNRALAAENKT